MDPTIEEVCIADAEEKAADAAIENYQQFAAGGGPFTVHQMVMVEHGHGEVEAVCQYEWVFPIAGIALAEAERLVEELSTDPGWIGFVIGVENAAGDFQWFEDDRDSKEDT